MIQARLAGPITPTVTVDRLRLPAMGATLAVASRKGGAGKILLVANLAAALDRLDDDDGPGFGSI
jgi:Mrp family chromosome partitioning ATPase